ncbi:ribonuclease H1 small subunit [Xylariaceae sp. AK1471]|nr:ribonuclease H1 small subunit [Xylariaceae sp. AK1471]
MPPPAFTIESEASNPEKATVNLLPCRIHHDGDANPSDTFWNPTKTQDGLQTAYLRGRKLHGKAVKLPEGYYGTVVEKTDAKSETSTRQEVSEDVEVIEDPEAQFEVGTMRGKATFDELMVWGHESTSDSMADPYVRGMEEWITFAEEIHSFAPKSDSCTK